MFTLLLIALLLQPAATPPAGSVLIENVTIVPMVEGQPDAVAGQDVLVAGETFAAIGPAGTLDVPPNTRRIDGRGKWLIPGLGDAHVHYPFQLGSPEGEGRTFAQEDARILNRLFVAHGVTVVRNMGGSPLVLKERDAIRRGEAIGPSILTVGPMYSGSDIGLFRTLGAGADVADILNEHEAFGYDAIKVHTSPDPDAFARLAAEAHDRDMQIVGHVPFTVGLSRTLEAGLDTIEHVGLFSITVAADDAPGTGEPWPAMMERYNHPDPAKIGALAEQLKAADATIVPTLTVTLTGAMTAGEFREHVAGDQYANRTSPAIRQHWLDRWPSEIAMYERAGVTLAGQRDTPRLVTKGLIDAGVTIVAGTDVPATPAVAGLALHEEIADYAELGMTPREALATATSGLADALDGGDTFGRIKPGLRADAVLLDADPLANIEHTKRVTGVLLRGEFHDRAALDAMLAEVDALVAAATDED